ncbi:MAG: zinc-binding dehydrogenase [Gemmatimonadota bacterium]|nr:zinc-binding dehydrogenase [Gemmatimonadota bacterium]
MRVISDHLDEGGLRPVICRRFPLEQVVEAHEFSESARQFGKILINP